MKALGKSTRKRDKPTPQGEATQVFRQFAWNLAGTLAKDRPPRRDGAPGRPGRTR